MSSWFLTCWNSISDRMSGDRPSMKTPLLNPKDEEKDFGIPDEADEDGQNDNR